MRCINPLCNRPFLAEWKPEEQQYEKYCRDCEFKNHPEIDLEQLKREYEAKQNECRSTKTITP